LLVKQLMQQASAKVYFDPVQCLSTNRAIAAASQKVCSPDCKIVCDTLSMQDIMKCVFSSLSIVEILSFVSTSKQCQQLVCPASLELDINSGTGLRVIKAFNRRGCLQQLQQAHLKASIGDAVAGAHFGLLGSCSSLRQLELVFEDDKKRLTVSVFLVGMDFASDFAHSMAGEESLTALKDALPGNARCTVHMLEECALQLCRIW